MQQIIKNDDGIMKSQLSKMIKKNSGGEGQNPLYVALLASFAQAYRIGLPPKLRRSPTIRLVVLDEAFSKMDAEKVASCIQLIRDLGFQAIISATNDKIQNYVENVNKTFVSLPIRIKRLFPSVSSSGRRCRTDERVGLVDVGSLPSRPRYAGFTKL